jgi:hypothetical protein
MVKSFLNFEKGDAIAKVIGGDLAGATLYLDTEDHKKPKKRLSLPRGMKLPPRKEAELMSFFHDAYARGIPPEHLQASEELKQLYETMLSSAESSTEVELPPNSTFSLIPTQDKKAREVWYIAGPSGSGKSYIAKGLAQAYHDYFPDRPIYLVSKLSEDSTLDKLKFLERLDPQKIVEDPISDLEILKDCMIIFDDVDTFDKETDKVIQKLIDDIATMGRHSNTTMLFLTHYLSNYKKTRLLLMEATNFVLYPQSTGSHAFNYTMKVYLGLDKDEAMAIRKSGSRWVSLKKSFPQYLITEHSARVMNQ